jgi:sugar O-acyltransferase (sialic acid O-acetyltransferase NeuD family)
MSKKQVVLIGGGGHCKSVIEAIQSDDHIDFIGVVDAQKLENVLGVAYLGDDSILQDLVNQHYQFLITVGNIGAPNLRIKLFDNIKSLNGIFTTGISPNALVAKSSSIGEGTVIMQHAIVNAEVVIGKNCIINSKALLEHETIIGDHVHISTGVIVNGQCKIGNNCFIGSGSVIGNNVSIADNTIIGAGSVVLKDIKEAGTFFGQPARKFK